MATVVYVYGFISGYGRFKSGDRYLVASKRSVYLSCVAVVATIARHVDLPSIGP